MEWLLPLGHGLLGALLLPFALAGPRTRRRAIEAAAVAGVVLGVALVVAGEAGFAPWRSLAFEARAATPAGLAAAGAWLVTGALAGRRTRVEEAALTGVAACGLILAACGRFVVPALIFWLCSSAALAAVGRPRARWTWVVLAVSDAAVCAAAVAHVWGGDEWSFDVAGEGLALPALVAAAVVRGGAHLGAAWPSLGTGTGAAAPLLAGGAVALAARSETAEPWVALLVLAAGAAAAGVALARNAIGPRVVATWATALALAACYVAPRHAAAAGAAAVLAVAAAALWPHTAGRGGVARSLVTSAVPLTAGFAAVAAASGAAFERATTEDQVVAWTLLAAFVPAALALGVVLGGRAARADVGDFEPEAVLATWLLLAAVIGIGVLPHVAGEVGPLGDSGGVLALQTTALVAGAAAGVVARRPGIGIEPAYVEVIPAELGPAPDLPHGVARATLAVAGVTAVAAAWLTVAGLRVGFL